MTKLTWTLEEKVKEFTDTIKNPYDCGLDNLPLSVVGIMEDGKFAPTGAAIGTVIGMMPAGLMKLGIQSFVETTGAHGVIILAESEMKRGTMKDGRMPTPEEVEAVEAVPHLIVIGEDFENATMFCAPIDRSGDQPTIGEWESQGLINKAEANTKDGVHYGGPMTNVMPTREEWEQTQEKIRQRKEDATLDLTEKVEVKEINKDDVPVIE